MNSNSLGSIDLCFLLSHKIEFGISVTSFDISALSVVKGLSNRVQKVLKVKTEGRKRLCVWKIFSE